MSLSDRRKMRAVREEEWRDGLWVVQRKHIGNLCRVFVCPSCHQPVLKTSTGPQPFFNHQHRRNIRGHEPVCLTIPYRYPTFWTEGYSTLTFQDKKVKNLLSPAVNRSDLLRINYNKTILGRGSTPDPAGRAHESSPRPHSRMRTGIFPPHSPLLSPRDPRGPRSPSESVPPL